MYYTEKQLIEFGNQVLNRKTDNPDNQNAVTDTDVENFKAGQPTVKMLFVDITEGRAPEGKTTSVGVLNLTDVEMLGADRLIGLKVDHDCVGKIRKIFKDCRMGIQ